MTRPAEKLIYDRTEADTIEARKIRKIFFEKGWNALTPDQKSEWTHGLRGCLNASDLTRISAWCSYLNYLYRTNVSTSLPVYNAQTWESSGNLLYKSQVSALVNNVIKLADAVRDSLKVDTKSNLLDPNAEKVTMSWLNNLEYVLSLCAEALDTH